VQAHPGAMATSGAAGRAATDHATRVLNGRRALQGLRDIHSRLEHRCEWLENHLNRATSEGREQDAEAWRTLLATDCGAGRANAPGFGGVARAASRRQPTTGKHASRGKVATTAKTAAAAKTAKAPKAPKAANGVAPGTWLHLVMRVKAERGLHTLAEAMHAARPLWKKHKAVRGAAGC
jgi:hypothetical protein